MTGVDNVGAALTKGVASTLLKFALKGGDEVPVGVAFSPTESRFVTVGAAKHGVIWSAERGLISSSKKMKNRDKLKIKERAPSWSVTYSPDGKFIAVGGTTGTVSIFKAKNGKRVDSIEAHNAPVTDVSFSADGSQLASSSHDGTVHHWDLSSGKTQRFQGEGKLWTVAFSRTGGSDVVLGAGTDGIARVWEAGTGAEIRQFRAQVQPISSIEIDASGRRIAMASPSGSSIKVWNLDTGLDVQIIDAEAQVNALAFTPDGSKIAAANTDMKARVFDVASGARVGLLSGHVAGSPSVFSMESGENIVGFMMGVTGMGVSGAEMVGMSKFQTNTPEDGVLHITFVDGGTRLVTGGEDETIRVWDWASGQQQQSIDAGGKVYAFAPDPEGRMIAASGGFSPAVWDITSGTQAGKLSGDMFHGIPGISVPTTDKARGINPFKIYSIVVSPDGRLAATGLSFRTIRIYDFTTHKYLYRLEGHLDRVTSLAFSADSQSLISSGLDNVVRVWDVSSREDGHEMRVIADHNGSVTSLAVSAVGNIFVSAGVDGTARVYDGTTLEPIATFVNVGDQDFAVLSPDNYYSATPKAASGLAFRQANQVFTFEQFDVAFNRPDIVFEKLGMVGAEKIADYSAAHDKRVSRLDTSVSGAHAGAPIPEVGVYHAGAMSAQTRDYDLRVVAHDAQSEVHHLKVWINDVPVYGSSGVDVRSDASNDIERTLSVVLSSGRNKVQVSAVNADGAESIRATFEVFYDGSQDRKPDLYVVAVGVSDYAGTDFDLNYAAKDATDLARVLSDNNERFANVHVVPVTDAAATREGILAARTRLEASKVDDHVVFFLAGHGLLDDELNYYFATSDIDFDNPGERGLGYTELEGILDGIPARNKLLMMDTCFSGEVDEDSQGQSLASMGSGVTARAVRGVSIKANRPSNRVNAFKLMQELFADVSRSSGALVISAAGGQEFAFEGSGTSNGVFTHTVINGLNDSTLREGGVAVKELRDYVQKNVLELTGGRQTPNTRRDNLELDFAIY